MRRHVAGREGRRILLTLGALGLGFAGIATAQGPGDPSPAAGSGPGVTPPAASDSTAALPAPDRLARQGGASSIGPGPTAPAAPMPGSGPPATSREAALEERIRQLEAMVGNLSGQVQRIQSAPVAGGRAGTAAPDAGGTAGVTVGGDPTETNPTFGTPGATGVGTGTSKSASGGPLAPGQSMPPNPAPSARFQMPPTPLNKPTTGKFGPGFEWKTEDEEYVLQFHDLTQIEFRGYEQGGQNPVHDTFAIPRQWWMFSGRVGKPYEYFVSFQHGFDVFNMLDTFFNLHYDDRVQFRFGRFKTPFTYEFYTLPIQGLINPERSLFFNNFALNRQIGAMLWGRVLNKTTDYAVGIFNQQQNGYIDTTDGKAFLGFLNFHPFGNLQGSLIENLNFGGSVDTGNQFSNQNTGPVPQTLRTSIATTGNPILGIPFLNFNNNVRQAGWHAFWDLHAAYYYRHLSLIAEWQSGFQDYALVSNLNQRTHLPIGSYYVQAGYFLTGETVSQRNVVRPLHPFDLRADKRGLGAFELAFRYNLLNINQKVFTAGLADPNQWTNNVQTIDTGFNWYWTTYIKWQFTWEHSIFGSPVVYNVGREQKSSDTFWVRFQLYF